MEKIAIIIPSYEPDERLVNLLKEMDAKEMGPVILVNDGSAGSNYDAIFEESKKIIEKRGGHLLKHNVNRGKGRALKTAFSYILGSCDDITAAVTADSDGQHSCECIQKVIDEIRKNKDSLVLGVRQFDLEGIPWKSRVGNAITEKVFQYVTGEHISDTQTGLRGIPREYMKELLDLKGERFEFEMRMLVDAVEKRKIIEVPIKTIYDSKENHQTHFNTFKDSIRIYKILAEKFVIFLISSLSSSIIDIVLFGILCFFLKESLPVVYITVSTVVARIISAAYNYLVNYKVVFKSKGNVGMSAIKYIILAVIQMLCSALLVTSLVAAFPTGSEIVLKIIIDALLFFVSYKVQQKFVFQKIKK